MALGSVSLNIQGDASGLARSVEQGLGNTIKKLTSMAAGIFAGVTAGSFIKDSIKQASDLNESLNAIRVTLGTGAESFLKFGKTAANSLGITQAALNEAVVPMAALLTNAGVQGEDLSKRLQVLATRATDVGSVFNKDVNEVLTAFGAAMRGEQEPIRQFGVNLNEAGIAAEAVRLKLAKNVKEVSQSAKTQAAYSLILQQTSRTQGDALNTADSYANVTRRIGAMAKEAQVSLGSALLPTVEKLAGKLLPLIQQSGPALGAFGTGLVDAGTTAVAFFRDQLLPVLQPTIDAVGRLAQTAIDAGPGLANLASSIAPAFGPLIAILPELIDGVGLIVTGLGKMGDFFAEHEATVGAFATAIGTLVVGFTAISIATGIWAATTGGLVTAFWALNAAMVANPIGAVVVAIAALAAGFVFAWKKSETFRKVVTTVFNALVSVIANTVKAWFNLIVGFWEGVLNLISSVPFAKKLIPGLEEATNAVHNFRVKVNSEIDQIKTNVQIVLKADGSQAFATLAAYQASLAGIGIRTAGAKTSTGFSVALDKGNTGLKIPKIAAPKLTAGATATGGGGGGGGSTGGGGASGAKKAAADDAKKAAEAAKKAAAKARAAADKSAGKQITARKFVDSVTGGQEAIKTAFDKLIADLKAGNKPKLAKYAADIQKQLLAIAVKRDAVTEQLSMAKDKLAELRKESEDYSRSVRDSITSTGNIATHNIITFTGIRNSLRHAVRQANEFRAAIAKLTSAGLNKQSLQDLIAAGPEAGLAAAKSLLQGGAKGITEVNNLTAQLGAAGTAMGNETANTFYQAGIQAAAGLVAGLQSQEAALNAQMDRMATQMATTLKRQLQIKSPSQVFAGIGKFIGAGLAQGIDASRGRVGAATGRLGASVVNNFGGISVSGIGNPVEMERGGIMAAHAVADTLRRNQAAMNLAGTG